VEAISTEYGAQRSWNHTSRTSYYRYRDRQGTLHEIDQCDSESLLSHLSLIGEHKIAGVSLWKIGGEDPSSHLIMKEFLEGDIGNLPPYVSIGKDLNALRGDVIDLGPVRAYDPDGWLTDFRWELGDGNTSGFLQPEHVYERSGRYNVTLVVTDNSGRSIERRKTVTIGPWAVISMVGTMMKGETITFDGRASWDPIGIVSYNWDMGDGTVLFHHGPKVSHTYSRPGPFTVKLTIISSTGHSDHTLIIVDIPDETPPVADAGEDVCLLYTSPSPRDRQKSRMPSSA
jgi:hypothetical protein